MERPDERDLAELAYTLSLRTLGQQEASLNELRDRTGTLLAAAALVASFLGATAIARIPETRTGGNGDSHKRS